MTKNDSREPASSVTVGAITPTAERPRVVAPAAETPDAERYCTCCKRPLSGRVAWLELDQRTGTYHDFGGVPGDESQGWFPFGMTCARAALARARGEQS